MAAATDLFRESAPLFQTTLGAAMLATDTAATLADVVGIPTATGVTITVDQFNAAGAATPALREVMTGVVSGSQIIDLIRGQDGTTAQSHANGAIVQIVFTSQANNDLMTGILVDHTQNGEHIAANVWSELKSSALAAIYPVGCIYTETTGVNPGTTFGFGTWIAFGGGRVMVGNGTSDQAFTAGATGGESNHTLTSTEMPSHNHGQRYPTGTGSAYYGGLSNAINQYSATTGEAALTTDNVGGGAAHNNLQPYIVVYFWERTA